MNRTETGTGINDRVGASKPAARSMPIDLSALDLWSFVVPVISFIEITVVGRSLWSLPDRPRLPRWFAVLWTGWLVIVGLVRGVTR